MRRREKKKKKDEKKIRGEWKFQYVAKNYRRILFFFFYFHI